ncbi:MAG: flagellar filament capping protein FliD [Pseudomonadota bacterium]
MATTSGINLSNIGVDSSGKITFSGLSSGIDYQTLIDNIIKAKTVPVDNLKTTIDDNKKKITAYNDFKSLLQTLQDSLSKMRGAVSVDGSANIFLAKQAFASTSRTDGATPSSASNLLGVTVTNAATVGSHTIEILRTATAHKVATKSFGSATTALGLSGSFDIKLGSGTAKPITVSATDTLQDLRDRINAANTGSSATGISASIVTVGTGQNYLVLTADQTGQTITFSNETGGVLAGLGISNDGGVTLLNQLQAPQTAQFYADGLLDSSKWDSVGFSSQTASLGSIAGVTAGSHTFNILDSTGAVIQTVSYSDTDSLQTLASNITAGGAGVTASVVQNASGQYQLKIVKTDGSAISFGGDTDNLLSSLSLTKEKLLIERSSNTVSDLFNGITLSLYGAEQGTTIKLDIDRNLTDVQNAITAFVDAYNAVRHFVNEQNQTDSSTGAKSADAGPLYGSRTLASISQALSSVLGTGTEGVSSAFSVLAQIGVTFVDNNTLSDPLNKDTLQIDSTKLANALTSNPDDVRKLFAFDFSSSDPRVTLLDFSGSTTYSATGYTLNLTHNGTSLTGADFNGVAGSATVSGNTITATSATGANGLKLYYSGNVNLSNVSINFTVGTAAQMFFDLQSALDSTTGTIQSEIDALSDQNTATQARVDSMLQRIDYQKQILTEKFNNMETQLSKMQSILDSIKQTTDAWSQNKN